MKLFKRTPRPADDLGYGIFSSAVKWLAIIVCLTYALVRLIIIYIT